MGGKKKKGSKVRKALEDFNKKVLDMERSKISDFDLTDIRIQLDGKGGIIEGNYEKIPKDCLSIFPENHDLKLKCKSMVVRSRKELAEQAQELSLEEGEGEDGVGYGEKLPENLNDDEVHPNFVSLKGDPKYLSFIETIEKKKRDARGQFGRNILHYAAITNNQAAVSRLLENGQNDAKIINGKDKQGNTALHQAVMNKNKQIILMLLSERAKCNLNRNDEGQAPIHLDAELQPWMTFIKYYEPGFRILKAQYKNNPLYTKVNDKVNKLLSFIWDKISDNGEKVFVHVDDLLGSGSICSRLRQSLAKKKETQQSQNQNQEQTAVQQHANPDDPDADLNLEEQKDLNDELTRLNELDDIEENFETIQGMDKRKFLLDTYCWIDKDNHRFVKEEFFFALVRQQTSSMVTRENECFDRDWDQLGRFSHYFRMLWEGESDLLDNIEGDGEDDEGGDDD